MTSVTHEAGAYLRWLDALAKDAQAKRQAVLSRTYNCEFMRAHSRYSRMKISVNGAPAFCIADIAITTPGSGFFTALCDRFSECTASPVSAFFVENVANQRFAAWLERRGFVHCMQSVPEMPTLYLER